MPRAAVLVVLATLALACGDDDPTDNAGSVELTLVPAALTIPQGGSGTTVATITRSGGFTAEVTLVVTGLPAGVTSSFDPASLEGAATTVEVTLTIGTAVALGAYSGTITARANGTDVASAPVQLTVQPATSGAGNVEYQYCSAADRPEFFAFQDGNGAWQVVPGSSAGGVHRYAFNVTQGRGGALAVYNTTSSALRAAPRRPAAVRRARPSPALRADSYATVLVYGTTAELAQDGLDNCIVSPATKTVHGTFAGLANGNYGVASMAASTAIVEGGVSSLNVTFEDIPSGPMDLAGSRITAPGTPPDRLILQRSLDVADGGTLPSAIDFSGSAALAPALANVTITGAGGDALEVYTELVTATSELLYWFDLAPSPTATRPWAGFPNSALRPGEFHGLVVFATTDEQPFDFRVSFKYVAGVAAQTIAVGPALDEPEISGVGGAAYPRLRFEGSLPSPYDKGLMLLVAPSTAEGNALHVFATGSWLGLSGTSRSYDVVMPDVSGLAGFPLASRLSAGENSVILIGFGFTGTGVFSTRPTLGSEYKEAIRTTTTEIP